MKKIDKFKQQAGQDILSLGSVTLVQSFMEAYLIDEYRFLVHPTIMGGGKRFFKDGMLATKLKLVKTETLNSGVTLDCYEPTTSRAIVVET